MEQKSKSSDLSLESEKTIPQHAENAEKVISTNVASGSDEPTFDAKATKRLLKKMDIRLVPFLALLYLLSFLDRTNIGNARLFGLEKDLGMAGIDYNVALAVFFPPYVLAEIPSNMMMKRYRPSVWLAIIMLAWSFCVIFMGFVNNLTGLVIARIFLGLAEGGLFPGVNYYITMWYRRHECGFRMALFFSAATLAGAFGGLLARAIGSMDGIGGKKGWAWIFIIEGLLTLVVAVGAYWVIVDYPATAQFLTPDEKLEVQRRLKLDRNSLADEFNMKFFWDALKDWKIYMQMLIYIGILTPLYSVSLFLPTIIKTMGDGKYTANTAQLMSVPPYIVGCVTTVAAGYYADKLKQRGIFMLGFQVIAVIGWVLLISSSKAVNQYIGTFFCVSGIYPLVPMSVAWNGNNIGGSLKRGVGIAMQVGFGNLGGCVSAFMYMSKDSPRFYSGHGALIGMIVMSFFLTGILTLYLRRENERRDRTYPAPESYTDEMKDAERERGDLASFYRYTI